MVTETLFPQATSPEKLSDVTALTLDLEHAAARLETASAEQILEWSVTTLPRLAVTSSFGADSAVLLHLVASVDPTIPVLFLDTGFHFPQTLEYRRELVDRLGLADVRDLRADLSVQGQAREHGPGLYLRNPDSCCGIRKVAPLNAALEHFDGWASGTRRQQTLERSGTPVVKSTQRNGRTLVKVSPLARWTADDVESYLVLHDLPRHPLIEAGFPSIGCAPCTRPVRDGDDPRAGRWPGLAKTECGIHLVPPGQQ